MHDPGRHPGPRHGEPPTGEPHVPPKAPAGGVAVDACLARIAGTTSRTALWRDILDFFTSHGIDKVSYHMAASDDNPAGIVCYGFPDDWVCHYISDDLAKVDPIPALAACTSVPFFWSEVPRMRALTHDMQAYLADMKAHAVGDGLALTVFGPNLRNAYVGLGLADPARRPAPHEIAEFQLIAQMAHLKVCELSDAAPRTPAALSRREREVLEWVARGKSNGVIAELLGVSRHTVDTLLRRCYDKLGVADRTSAAITALGSGLLQYHDVRA
ncbi:MAG: helix-turn-helix transcriptional regulator [Shimia sp.]